MSPGPSDTHFQCSPLFCFLAVIEKKQFHNKLKMACVNLVKSTAIHEKPLDLKTKYLDIFFSDSSLSLRKNDAWDTTQQHMLEKHKVIIEWEMNPHTYCTIKTNCKISLHFFLFFLNMFEEPAGINRRAKKLYSWMENRYLLFPNTPFLSTLLASALFSNMVL